MSFIYNMADTWNAVGTIFNGIYMNISNGAGGAPVGAAASRAFRLDSNLTSIFDIDISGNVVSIGGIKAQTNLALLSATGGFGGLWLGGTPTGAPSTSNYTILFAGSNTLINAITGQNISFNVNNSLAGSINTTSLHLISALTLDWNSDLFLARDAANALALRNGTTAQKFSVYNTFTDASNFERAVIDWASFTNILAIGTQNLGTGTGRAVILQQTPITLASLPTPASAGSGARMFISDATLPVIFATATGGGSTPRPVFSNGANWLCG